MDDEVVIENLIWKKCTYPGVKPNFYMISEDGQLMNIITLKKLRPYNQGGYWRYCVASDPKNRHDKSRNRTIAVMAHRLVAYQFCPNPNNYPIVDHLDGDKSHCVSSNLEWVTHSENTRRAIANGLMKIQGDQHTSAKFDEELVRAICEKLQDGWNIKEIFRWICQNPKATPPYDYPLYQLINRLKLREGWPNVTCDYDYPSYQERKTGMWDKQPPGKGHNIYDEEMIRKVCEYLEKGKSAIDILEIFTGSRCQKDNRKLYDFIDGIRRKRHWTEISKDYNIDNNSTRTRNTGWDQEIADMVDFGMSKSQIRSALGAKWDSREGHAINRMIDRYIEFKSLKPNTNITVIEKTVS